MIKTELMTFFFAGMLCFATTLPAATIVVEYPKDHVLYQREAVAGPSGTSSGR